MFCGSRTVAKAFPRYGSADCECEFFATGTENLAWQEYHFYIEFYAKAFAAFGKVIERARIFTAEMHRYYRTMRLHGFVNKHLAPFEVGNRSVGMHARYQTGRIYDHGGIAGKGGVECRCITSVLCSVLVDGDETFGQGFDRFEQVVDNKARRHAIVP